MPVERSAGAVIFRDTKKGPQYLLLHHYLNSRARERKSDGHWDFSKGHIEKGEKTEDTVRREIEEETGISDITFIPGFKETTKYFVGTEPDRRLKFVAFFLAKTHAEKVAISHEHQGFAWLPFEEACERVTYKDSKNLLKRANAFLSAKSV